ncbi:MAG TPA: fumarylacetoacetate hydrolase family protein [Trueperaceae bacterium]|nr:fumarylacetoacetate hydrolase family protein [Trueperaceae bacterium]
MQIIRGLTSDGSIVHAALQADGSTLAIDGALTSAFEVTGQRVEIVRRLAPLVPTAILAIGLNYRQHAIESGMELPKYPILFHKTVSCVQGPDAPILLPAGQPCTKVDYEVELAVVIGRTCKDVSRADALDYVLGYTVANDVSARDWQLEKGGGQWSYGKSFDTFCPLGPVLVTADEIPDPSQLHVRTTINGEVMQDSPTSDLIFDVPDLIAFLSAGTTLQAGTVILTGTPQGVGMGRKPQRWLVDGDVVTVSISRIGDLTNTVVAEAAD